MSPAQQARTHAARTTGWDHLARHAAPSATDVSRALGAAVVLAGNRLERKSKYLNRCVQAGRDPHAWHLVEIDRAQYLHEELGRAQVAVAELIAADDELDAANAAWRRAAAEHGGGHPAAEEAYRRVQRAQERRAAALASCRPPQ